MQGFIKANLDASLNEQNMGIGIVIRDEKGEVMASACYKKQPVKDPTLAESLALWQTVELCNDLGLNKVILEAGDAQAVVNDVNRGEDQDLSLCGHIIEDIKLAVLRGRHNWKVQYINRKGNEGAYSLAKAAVQFEHEVGVEN
ncbi:uncharacterized protein LOC121235360 [Juglans microcarpa x Juglans regia]|uniref:uncharacterized protein LOC121235360 n=1 Tax=Juglans microcarpa x Juglans regia TaxID=2249226 RepID=UPI001B7DBFD3|nr:uncharacterized protein LOC121235360 [Juglans microcarpa x Juglans regia]